MAFDLKAYTDSSKTTELTPLQISQLASGGSPDIDKTFYLASASGGSFQANSNPGVDPVLLSIVDANVGGGIEASNIKLALSSSGLTSAVAGAALDLGVTIGAGVTVYVRSDTPALSATDNDITLTTNTLLEI